MFGTVTCRNFSRERRFVLPPAMEWFYRMRRADYLPLPPFRADCTGGMGDRAVSLSLLYLVGFALGAPIVGVAIDVSVPAGGFAAAGLAGLAAALTGYLLSRSS